MVMNQAMATWRKVEEVGWACPELFEKIVSPQDWLQQHLPMWDVKPPSPPPAVPSSVTTHAQLPPPSDPLKILYEPIFLDAIALVSPQLAAGGYVSNIGVQPCREPVQYFACFLFLCDYSSTPRESLMALMASLVLGTLFFSQAC